MSWGPGFVATGNVYVLDALSLQFANRRARSTPPTDGKYAEKVDIEIFFRPSHTLKQLACRVLESWVQTAESCLTSCKTIRSQNSNSVEVILRVRFTCFICQVMLNH